MELLRRVNYSDRIWNKSSLKSRGSCFQRSELGATARWHCNIMIMKGMSRIYNDLSGFLGDSMHTLFMPGLDLLAGADGLVRRTLNALDFACVPLRASATPHCHTKEEHALYDRGVKEFAHLCTKIELCQLAQKVQPLAGLNSSLGRRHDLSISSPLG